MKDPRVALASVVSVDVSPDLRHAQVLISALGEDDARRSSVAALQRAAPFLRGVLARRLHLRNVPELRFGLDRGAELSQRISDLLENLHDDDPSA
jgi:ribosome-binding factor A